MDPLRIDFETTSDEGARQFIINSLDNHNIAATGIGNYHPLNLFLRSPRNEILGGLLGYVWGGWLQVQHLWVAEQFRHRGEATRLMDAAEAYAIERGCSAATLDTHSFQARPFYERRGYVVVGTLEGYPPGHAKYLLRKTLRPAA